MLSSFVCRKRNISVNVSRSELSDALRDKDAFVWVDLETPNEFESDSLVELFNFHPLAIEDCLNDRGEPKLHDYEEYLFLVVHAVSSKLKEELKTTELDIFMGKNYLVTFHGEPLSSIAEMRDLMSRKSDPLVPDGADMLLHAILDRLVDNYLPLVMNYGERLDEIEDQLFHDGKSDFLPRALALQKEVLFLKRIIEPQREVISELARSARSFVRSKNMIYFRDIDDHLFRLYQMTEELSGFFTGIFQVYFANASHKLNEAMKTLTVIATISLPPMVIASIYGMNFKAMPELDWSGGYFFALGLMTVSSGIVIIFLKWKRWF